jgi:S-DNA-T family DNA segregation ATPase FtsK/SpoIIIE
MDASQIETVAQRGRSGGFGLNARRRYVIDMRKPYQLPEDKLELPSPEPLKGQPPNINLISTILPPVMMVIVVIIYAQLSPDADMRLMILMPMMSMAFPIGNLISYYFQKKDYRKGLQIREQNYRSLLAKSREGLEALARQQRETLEIEYPVAPKLAPLALGQTSRRRLWCRRPTDSDFLSLRMGTGTDRPSFTVSMPRVNDPNEPLMPIAQEVVDSYQEISRVPILLDLHHVGSLAITSKSGGGDYSLSRRLILDILLHHSPQDVQIAVISDVKEAQERWGWLKWAPHTRSILQGEAIRRLAFNPASIDKCLEWVVNEFNQRKDPEPGVKRKGGPRPSIVVIMDDSGDFRQSGEIKELASAGHEADIFLVFAGGKYFPRECRARVDVSDQEFSYMETFAGEKGGKHVKGTLDPASLQDCERMARGLAGLEISSGGGGSDLPESVRLFDLLDAPQFSPELVRQAWGRLRSDDELLHFSFGFKGGRKGLENVELNLLPEDLGGIGAYHTILVGTTGSGKSEFMKSLVLSAAFRYSPQELDFFFMDFKGGAAFNVLKDLPHVVGVVTNLSPHLVERGLSAMEAEIDLRQKLFAEAAVQNIWAYNEKYPAKPLPHLLLLLDEFARGLEEFPRLPDMLDRLVRQGRSLGIYLLLANQDVNAAVDKLLNNVGWRIALKVARQEEMHIVERSLPIAKRAGQGYLVSTINEPLEFQAAYAGFAVKDEQEEVQEAFKIFQVEGDGRWQLIHSSARQARSPEPKRVKEIEQDQLISVMKSAAEEIEPARPIYLDPLEEQIPLEKVFEGSALQRVFDGTWHVGATQTSRLIAPIGFIDSPKECLQQEMEIDFDDQDGHLWIIGSPGSGKAMTLETILLSLALTHTPEQVWFYILEYGAGQLLKYDALPHTGAVLRSTDPEERLDKLINFLDDEMDRRMEKRGRDESGAATDPAIFLVINNFAEMRTEFPDQADRITRFARDGKAVGLHLIITTNRRVELARLIIARKIVLWLANRDEHMDAIGKSVSMPASQAEGRGLFVVDQSIVECQIAQPLVNLNGQASFFDARATIQAMNLEWKGPKARSIGVLPSVIPLFELLDPLVESRPAGMPIPVGVSFETQDLIAPRLLKEFPRWLVLGPPRSGKSNFLACIATSVLEQSGPEWEIHYLSLRRSPLDWVQDERIKTQKTTEDIIQTVNGISESAEPESGPERQTLVLVDDLGGAFEPGREAVAAALNNLAQKAAQRENVFIVGAGMAEEMRSQQMSSQLVKSLKQGRTGMCLSKDMNDIDWFGSQVPMEYRRIDLPAGRGFWVSGGRATLLQTPRIGEESET